MRAVNLIPPDARVGGAGGNGRSGGAVYVLLGGLAALVLLTGLWAAAHHGTSGKRTELAQLQQETADAQQTASRLAGFGNLTALRQSRTATVTGLAAGRFDWAGLLDDVARTMPRDAHLTSLQGTVAATTAGATGAMTPAASGTTGTTGTSTAPTGTSSAASGTSTAAASPAGPSITIQGCTRSHARVALLMARLRALPGVTDIKLTSSTASTAAAGATGASAPTSAGSSGGCPGRRSATFAMTLQFAGIAMPAAAGTSAPGTAPGTPAPAGTATTAQAPATGTATTASATAGTATTAAGPAPAAGGPSS
jgi:Tfp pilus assembly protein PilN